MRRLHSACRELRPGLSSPHLWGVGISFLLTTSLAAQTPRSPTHPAIEGAAPGNWLPEVSARLQRAEYRFSQLETDLWSAPNRGQDLRVRMTSTGIEVFPRETDASGEGAAWNLRIRTTSFGRVDALSPAESGALSVANQRAELRRTGWGEWYINGAEGVEQGWTIFERPGGSSPLAIGVGVDGDLSLRITASNNSGVFRDESGEPRVLYGKLEAWDASGRPLAASLRPAVQGALIVIDDSDAIYPVTVDPLMTNAAWTGESNQADARFAASVSSAGDVNNDGFSDVIVGAYTFDNGEFDEGRAYLFLGSSTGLSTTEAWTAEPDQASAFFGIAVSTAGDVNGDGFSDVIVGASRYDGTRVDSGGAFVYLGSGSGLSLTPDWSVDLGQTSSNFGSAVSTAGDVNGDGYSDVIVGALHLALTATKEGGAAVYLGSATGLATTPAWLVFSGQTKAFLGKSVSSAGDVNGDGFSDVLVGAPAYDNGEIDEGRVFLYLGSSSGLSTTAAWTAEPNQGLAAFGTSVSSAGDVDGDGFSDVIVGAPLYSSGQSFEGRAYVYHGSASGLSATPAWTAESDQANGQLGSSVSDVGDFNGDGFADVLVGVQGYANGESFEGQIRLYFGSATGLDTTEAWTAESNQASALLGESVSGAGDVNGDGFFDLIAGSSSFDNGELNEGRAFVYHGFSLSTAAGSIFNGTGFNPLCLGSEPPVLGQDWNSTLFTIVRPGATSSLFLIRALPSSGTFLAGGELLVNLNSPQFLSRQIVSNGGPTTIYTFPIPADASIAGISATSQGAVFSPSGYTLCNGYTFTIGL